jgi:hypothetical protein
VSPVTDLESEVAKVQRLRGELEAVELERQMAKMCSTIEITTKSCTGCEWMMV